MYRSFSIDDLRVKEADNCIQMSFTQDLDEDTVDGSSVYITEVGKKNQPIIETRREVDGNTVKLYPSNLKVNTDYEVIVKNAIHSIVDKKLHNEYRKVIRIESIVDSTVKILSPTEYEYVTDSVAIELEEIAGPSKTLQNNYEIEIASDVTFFDIIQTMSLTKKQSVTVALHRKASQYFIRARAVASDGSFGNWSDKVTFSPGSEKKHTSSNSTEDDNDAPILEEDLEIIAGPENGETPQSFIFEFNDELDPASVDMKNLILTRKKV